MTRSHKNKPLLRWMDEGDPGLTPIVMGDARSTAASYFGLPARDENVSTSHTRALPSPITPDRVLQCCRETGIHPVVNIGGGSGLNLLEFAANLEVESREEVSAEGVRRHTTIRTPVGEVSECFFTPRGGPGCWVSHYLRDDRQLEVFVFIVEALQRAVLENPQAAARITAECRAEAQRWPAWAPFKATVGIPAFLFMCNAWVNPPDAFYILCDHRETMERLFEQEMATLPVWVDAVAAGGADFIIHAVNGLEMYSMDIWRRYFVPQTQALHRLAHDRGLRSWVHTCGHMQKLIDVGAYQSMEIDVLESLSHPPLGTVGNLRDARAGLGTDMTTRGAVNVSLFYERDLQQIRARVRQVLAETRGYRHMIGDTNDSYPPYPKENILAVVEEVARAGRTLPAC